MAEVSIIFAPDDKLEFAAWLRGEYAASFIPDDDSEAVRELTDVVDLEPVLRREFPTLVFILSHSWSHLPLYKRKAVNQYKGEIHYVMQRYGGPAFTWMPGNCISKPTGKAYSAGFFGDYPSYYVAPGSSRTIKRPANMTSAFRAARKWIASLCEGRRVVAKQSGDVGSWISSRAWREVQRGSASLANDALTIVSTDVA